MSGFAVGLPQPAQAKASTPDPADAAIRAAEQVIKDSGPADRLHRSPFDRFIRQSVTTGPTGLRYAAYERTYRGLPVIGGDFVITTDPAGKVVNTSVAQRRGIDLDTTASISAAAAQTTARTTVAAVDTASSPRLVVLATGKQPVLAWETMVTGRDRDNSPSKRQVLVDAHTGTVLSANEQVKSDTGRSYYNGDVSISTTQVDATTYKMVSKNADTIACGGMDGEAFEREFQAGANRVWGNWSGTDLETACVDALHAANKTNEMLNNVLGRNGVDGNGHSLPIWVGLDDVNAWYWGDHIEIGHSGDGMRQGSQLDIVGHELGHGVFAETPGGWGGGAELAGMAEAASDIFGTLTEYRGRNANDRFDYTIAELIQWWGGTSRYQYQPSLDGSSPDCYPDLDLTADEHDLAGPLNHWFYLLSEGSNPTNGMPASPTCDGSVIAGRIGPEKAIQIFYGGLLAKTATWTHSDVRTATLVAAQHVQDQCATFDRVRSAWEAVEVPAQADEPGCRPNCGAGVTGLDRDIPDGSDSLKLVLNVTGCTQDRASTTSTINVHIAHGGPEQLKIVLGAPDGTKRTLRENSNAPLTPLFVKNLSSEDPNGAWTLEIIDKTRGGTGWLDEWSLYLG